MRLIRNRPAHPSMSPTNPSTHRAEALRAAVPDPCAAAAQQHDPALGGRHEGLGEKCGLGPNAAVRRRDARLKKSND
jgi:hypothetical protein